MPSWAQTGVPIHFHSSTIPGSASWMSLRTLASVFPRQSASSLILSSIIAEADSTGTGLFMCTSIARTNRTALSVIRNLGEWKALSVSGRRATDRELDSELLCVLGGQSLPTVELHGLRADDASDRLAGEEPLEDVEADVPARGAPGDEAAIDVVP